MSTWAIRDGAIVEQPRAVQDYPLLARIYRYHDELISRHLDGRVLELAFGRHLHPSADVGVDAWSSNAEETPGATTVGDARALPFRTGSFDAVVGRRFLHHVPDEDRTAIVEEASRVLSPGGRLVLLEGTPGTFRRVTKGVASALGVLGEDTDVYGHLSAAEVRELVDSEFDIAHERTLGSPLMVASIAQSRLAERLFRLYRSTQCVQWWTLVVGRCPA